MSQKATEKYLRQYAEPFEESCFRSLARVLTTQCAELHYVLVIPAYKESPTFLTRLAEHKDAHVALLILVVNQPKPELGETFTASTDNLRLIQHIHTHANTLWEKDNASLHHYRGLLVLLLNHSTEKRAINKKQGVGAARKIGADMAVRLLTNNLQPLKSKPLIACPVIYSTDADTCLPENYFSTVDAAPPAQTGAWVFNYSHFLPLGLPDNNGILKATLIYESAIKYFQKGLAWAGSPYAFHTLGSTLAIHCDHYCQVRGFPKRAAGEDFYLLNKLAKIGHIEYAKETKIHIEARLSDRVPFGTGPAVEKIIVNGMSEYRYYSPACFTALKRLLEEVAHDGITAIFSLETQQALKSLSYEQFLLHAKKHCKNRDQELKQFHAWFDGFKTLKFIRFFTQNFHPEVPLDECLDAEKNQFVNINFSSLPT